MSKIAVIKTNPENVLKDYEKVMDLAKYNKILKKDKETILKLNLSWSLYYPACSTQPWQLEGVINKLKKDKFKKIIPVENRTVVTDIKKGVKENKWGKIFEKNNIDFVPLTKVKWTSIDELKLDFLALNDVFPESIKIPEFFKNKQIIHLPTLKTHGHTTMTGAMKNAFGGLITRKRHHAHKKIHEILVDLLKIQKKIHPKIFAVMDGTVAGNGAGPRTMVPVTSNLILASEDQVAIDAVAAKIMGFDPMKIKYIKLAHDLGLGNADVESLDLVGIDKLPNLNFKTNKSPVIFFDQLFRKKLKPIEKILFHSDLFYLCIMGSAIYHDKVWYNLVGKKRVKEFNKTEWGKLFEGYK